MLENEPGEFTFTALAGTPVAEIDAALAGTANTCPLTRSWSSPARPSGDRRRGAEWAGPLSLRRRPRFHPRRALREPRGQLIRSGGKVVKNAAGFDISKLMVGSLGGLGVLAELSFKVFPEPEAYSTLRVPHPTLDDASATLHRLTGPRRWTSSRSTWNRHPMARACGCGWAGWLLRCLERLAHACVRSRAAAIP